MIAIVNNESFVAGTANGEIGGAFGALGLLHNPFAQRPESGWRACGVESELDIGGFDFAAGRSWCRRLGTGSGKPECVGIQSEQPRRRSGGVAELEAEFDRGDLRRRARQQQIGIADGVKSRRAAESAAQFMTASRLADMMDL